MSPNHLFPLDESPENPITLRTLDHPRVTYHVDAEALVVAIRDELIVRADAVPALGERLTRIAAPAGSLSGGAPPPRSQDTPRPPELPDDSRRYELPSDPQLWRLLHHGDDPIDVSRRLRKLVREDRVPTRNGPELSLPAVSPNHVCVVAKFNSCPAGPPSPIPPPPHHACFVQAPQEGARASVVVIDTGYIPTDPPHAQLDARVRSVPGYWRDTTVVPPRWRRCPADSLDADHDGRLDGVAGHGTFIAGLIAQQCRQAEITLVGQRHDVVPLADDPDLDQQARLFSTEFDVAHSLLHHSDADVVSCGFAFPTLDAYPSIPFSTVMQVLAGAGAPRPGVAVVSPAGNEGSARAYWPAAHPDVIGVTSSNRLGTARAWFSNWGPWADCATRGQDVRSTYIHWTGPVEGELEAYIQNFIGWARWDGTSFAAPKLAAAIACRVAAADGAVLPVDAYQELVGGGTEVVVTALTDMALSPFPGVTLPYLDLG